MYKRIFLLNHNTKLKLKKEFQIIFDFIKLKKEFQIIFDFGHYLQCILYNYTSSTYSIKVYLLFDLYKSLLKEFIAIMTNPI